ncbi:hypothetical protein GCM10020366_11430 [Saccharopolyspora gregorii]|uniref:Uncharacterized protein n=1 Tax=Saccharopolyspora gregorii TaxID=33914 RepID=A0ABP6RR64_9PSEU
MLVPEALFTALECFGERWVFKLEPLSERSHLGDVFFLIPVVEVLLGSFFFDGFEEGIPVDGAIFG